MGVLHYSGIVLMIFLFALCVAAVTEEVSSCFGVVSSERRHHGSISLSERGRLWVLSFQKNPM